MTETADTVVKSGEKNSGRPTMRAPRPELPPTERRRPARSRGRGNHLPGTRRPPGASYADRPFAAGAQLTGASKDPGVLHLSILLGGEDLVDLVENPLETRVGHQCVEFLEHVASQLADPAHQLGAGD